MFCPSVTWYSADLCTSVSRFECASVAGGLSPNVARDSDRGVRVDGKFGTLGAFPYVFFFSSHDRAFLDAVATDIIHQHSGRLDYYKGYFTDIDVQHPLLRRALATSRSSIQQNLSGSETCGASTKRR